MTCLFTTSLHLRRKTVMSNAAKVTVVIPNYNGLKFMEPCFKALEMQICRAVSYTHLPLGLPSAMQTSHCP